MPDPDLPPDSITTLPIGQRTAAIRERHQSFAYSGPSAADRERDTVIAHLLDQLEAADRQTAELAVLRESVAKVQPAVQAAWDFLVAQIMPAWRAVEPILTARETAERERLVHDDPVLAAQIREGIAEAERGETVDLGDFAQYLEACREFRVACVALFWAVAEGLRLPQFLSWLSRRLGGDGA